MLPYFRGNLLFTFAGFVGIGEARGGNVIFASNPRQFLANRLGKHIHEWRTGGNFVRIPRGSHEFGGPLAQCALCLGGPEAPLALALHFRHGYGAIDGDLEKPRDAGVCDEAPDGADDFAYHALAMRLYLFVGLAVFCGYLRRAVVNTAVQVELQFTDGKVEVVFHEFSGLALDNVLEVRRNSHGVAGVFIDLTFLVTLCDVFRSHPASGARKLTPLAGSVLASAQTDGIHGGVLTHEGCPRGTANFREVCRRDFVGLLRAGHGHIYDNGHVRHAQAYRDGQRKPGVYG